MMGLEDIKIGKSYIWVDYEDWKALKEFFEHNKKEDMLERDRVIAMSDEEAYEWINSQPQGSPEFIRRRNVVYGDCGLTRAGFDINRPIKSGELICTVD